MDHECTFQILGTIENDDETFCFIVANCPVCGAKSRSNKHFRPVDPEDELPPFAEDDYMDALAEDELYA